MKKQIAAFVAVLAVSAFIADAAYADNVGCGLGRIALKGKKGKVFEILAVTTNGTFASQTFAITSGTSGYQEGVAIGMNDIDVYVAENMDNLATDIAKGDGEYIDTLATMMNVSDKTIFKSKMKSNFNNIFTSENVTSKEVVANINRVANS
jgi:hypothetical protein